jgi:hypothetical protein
MSPRTNQYTRQKQTRTPAQPPIELLSQARRTAQPDTSSDNQTTHHTAETTQPDHGGNPWQLAADSQTYVHRQDANTKDTLRKTAALVDDDCPPDILEQMASYPDGVIRYTVATHRSCPPEVLRQLMRDTDIDVARAATNNRNTSPADRAMWQLAH